MFFVNSEGSFILQRSQLSTPFLMTSKFTNRLYSTIDDSHGSRGIRLDDIPISPGSAFESLDVLLGVRIQEHRKRGGCCEIQECLWKYSEDTWYSFWWTVECRRGSYNQKRVADWFWTSPFCKWPGWYGLSRNRLWLGLGKVLQQHFSTGPITCWKWHWNSQTTLKMSCFLIDWQHNAECEQPTVNIWTRQTHEIHNRTLPVVWSMFQN